MFFVQKNHPGPEIFNNILMAPIDLGGAHYERHHAA